MFHSDARELVTELEFVWDQIKNNSASSSNSSPGRQAPPYNEKRRFQQPLSGNDGPMRVLSPMSQDDESEARRRIDEDNDNEYDDEEDNGSETDIRRTKKWRRKVEAAMVKMTAEMAALREQIETGREWRGRRRRTPAAWVGWFIWLAIRHAFIDVLLLGIVLIWMRRRKDRRIEDLVRDGLRVAREYIRQLLPAR
jgi:hypothetical protein